MPGRRKASRQYTKERMRAFARDRLENPEPMEVEPRAENTEVMHVNGMTRLIERIPARLEVTQLREPGTGPWRVYKADSFDSDFAGSGGSEFDTWDAALAAAKDITPGHRAYVDDSSGTCVLRAVHHPAKSVCPW